MKSRTLFAVLMLISFAILTASCGTQAILAPTETLTPIPPTETPTLTPSQEPTSTPTTIPLLSLGEFQGEMTGIGEHASMVCIQYTGNPNDLNEIGITSEFIQNEKTIETRSLQEIDGELCFEMTDAMYRPSFPVTLRIHAKSESYILENETQTIDLGDFQWKPFIYPMFAQSDFSKPGETWGFVPNHGYEEGRKNTWYANDFCKNYCRGNEHAPGEGTPVFMPFSIQIVAVREVNNAPNYPNSYNIWVFHPYTGFIFQFSHQIPGPVILDYLSSVGFTRLPTLENDRQYYSGFPYRQAIIPYDPKSILSYWAPSDHPNGPPHLHFEGQIHYPTLGLNHPDLFPLNDYVDGRNQGNCYDLGLEYGPCYDENGKIVIANISTEQFLIADWIDPAK
jgi:hypothetical protein